MATPLYNSDQPIHKRDHDKFSRRPFAEGVAKVLSERTDASPITIGINGPWGDGKTSVLNMIEEILEDNADVIVTKFNPWLFGSIESLLKGFFDTLSDALGRRLTTGRDLTKSFTKHAVTIAGSIAGASTGDTADKLLAGPSIIELKERVEKSLIKEKKRVVILVDDIDRLEISEIHAIFKLIKLVGDFKHTSYILAFDRDVVANSIASRYGDRSQEAGEHFLEKIIQLPLQLPAIPPSDLFTHCLSLINSTLQANNIEAKEDRPGEFALNFQSTFLQELKTPRKCAVYSNVISFSAPLLRNEANLFDLLSIEAVRIFTPDLYHAIRDNKQHFTGASHIPGSIQKTKEAEEIKSIIANAIRKHDPSTKRRLEKFSNQMFPSLGSVYGNTHYGDSTVNSWSKNQRICSEDYFDRYFTYSIPTGDIPDSQVHQLLDSLKSWDITKKSENPLSELLSDSKTDTLLRKLYLRVESIKSTPHLRKIAISFAQVANCLPHPLQVFRFTPRSRAASLSVACIEQSDSKERLGIAKLCVDHTPCNEYKIMIRQRLMPDSNGFPGQEEGFPEDLRNQLDQHLALNFITVLESSTDITLEDSNFPPRAYALANQFNDEKPANTHLTKAAESDPEAIARVLNSFAGITSNYTGPDTRMDFNEDNYGSANTIFGKELLIQLVKSFLGNNYSQPDSYPERVSKDDDQMKLVAMQYLFIYNKNQSESDLA